MIRYKLFKYLSKRTYLKELKMGIYIKFTKI